MWLSLTPAYWSRDTAHAQWTFWPLQRAEDYNGGQDQEIVKVLDHDHHSYTVVDERSE